MSYLQIYQEKIYDLLNSTNKVELSLREHPLKGLYIYTSQNKSSLCDYEAESYPNNRNTNIFKKVQTFFKMKL